MIIALFLLEKGVFQQQAMMVSCHQDIAGHSAFSLGMIAAFKEPVAGNPFTYRQLFWESGMIGQVLYLAAEAQGVRGTGIGCFFDDAVHDISGVYRQSISEPVPLHHRKTAGRLRDSPPIHPIIIYPDRSKTRNASS